MKNPLAAIFVLFLAAVAAEADCVVDERAFAGLTAETAALILSGQEGGTLDLASQTLVVPEKDGSAVSFALEVSGAALLDAAAGSDRLRLEIFVYGIGEGAAVRDASMRTVYLSDCDDKLSEAGVRLVGELALPLGGHHLRMLVRSSPGELFALRSLPLESTSPTRALLSPPLFSPSEAWIEVGHTGGFPPGATQPVVTGPGERSFSVLGKDLDDSPMEPELLVTGAEGETRIPARLLTREASGAAEILRMSAVFPELPPGRYMLSARWGENLASPQLPFIVSDDSTKTWVTLDIPPAKPALVPLAEEARELSEEEAGELRDAYREALQNLLDEDMESAVAAVTELESRLLSLAGPVALPELATLQFEAAREVTQDEPLAWIPIVLLHVELLHSYRQLGERERAGWTLATHSRRLASGFVESYGDRGSPKLAAALLVLLGVEMQRGQLLHQSIVTFQRALELDPDADDAVLGLVASFEKLGQFKEILPLAPRIEVIREHGGDPMLRLALALERRGRPRMAQERWRQVAEGGFDAWARTIAYQELVRHALDARRYDLAEKILLEALARYPDDRKLLLQDAYLCSLTGQNPQTLKILNELASQSLPRQETPRHRLAQWPEGLRSRAREALRTPFRPARDDLQKTLLP